MTNGSGVALGIVTGLPFVPSVLLGPWGGLLADRFDKRRLLMAANAFMAAVAALLGGFAHFFGPIVGAFVFIYLQDWVMSVVPYWRLIFGAILAVIVIVAPGGLMGVVARPRPMEVSRA